VMKQKHVPCVDVNLMLVPQSWFSKSINPSPGLMTYDVKERHVHFSAWCHTTYCLNSDILYVVMQSKQLQMNISGAWNFFLRQLSELTNTLVWKRLTKILQCYENTTKHNSCVFHPSWSSLIFTALITCKSTNNN